MNSLMLLSKTGNSLERILPTRTQVIEQPAH